MSNNFNITRLPTPSNTVSQPGMGQTAKDNAGKNVKMASEPLVRTLPGLTRYNSELGTVELLEDMGALPQEGVDDDKPIKKDKAEDASPSRYAKWQEEQTAKKEAREQAKLERATKQEALASSHLAKGDIHSAAKALNMSPQELIDRVQRAALAIPSEVTEKKLSPQEEKEKREEQYRQRLEKTEEEFKTFKYQTIANKYIEQHIDPIIQDTEKFELINKQDVSQIKSYVYQYMNQHYQETCKFDSDGNLLQGGEELSAKDVLETIEEQLEAQRLESLEDLKGTKKFSKFFADPNAKAEEDQEEEADPWTSNTNVSLAYQHKSSVSPRDQRRKELAISQERPLSFESEEDDEEPMLKETVANVRRVLPSQQGTEKTWRSMTRTEQLALLRKEDTQKQRASRR